MIFRHFHPDRLPQKFYFLTNTIHLYKYWKNSRFLFPVQKVPVSICNILYLKELDQIRNEVAILYFLAERERDLEALRVMNE